MTHLLLYGNAYAQIIRNGKGEVIALYPLMANRMSVDRDDKGHLYYQYQMQDSDAPTMKNGTVISNLSDVLHVPGLGFDGLVGYSPIAMAKNAIRLFSRASVTNSLMDKLAAKCRIKKPEIPERSVDSLMERLDLIKQHI